MRTYQYNVLGRGGESHGGDFPLLVKGVRGIGMRRFDRVLESLKGQRIVDVFNLGYRIVFKTDLGDTLEFTIIGSEPFCCVNGDAQSLKEYKDDNAMKVISRSTAEMEAYKLLLDAGIIPMESNSSKDSQWAGDYIIQLAERIKSGRMNQIRDLTSNS